MGNKPHQRPSANGHGHVPAAFAADGQDHAPPPDAERNLASCIGEAVALHLGQLLQQAIPQLSRLLPLQPGCVLCVADTKRAEAAWLTACQEAAEADAPPPQRPAPNVQPSVTWMPLGPEGRQTALPVCYGHFQLGPEVRSVGLVDAGGNPILARGGA